MVCCNRNSDGGNWNSHNPDIRNCGDRSHDGRNRNSCAVRNTDSCIPNRRNDHSRNGCCDGRQNRNGDIRQPVQARP